MNGFIKSIATAPFKVIDIIAAGYSRLLGIFRGDLRYFWDDQVANRVQARVQNVFHNSSYGKKIRLSLAVPNRICRYRADTFSSKEPETLEWLDQYGGDGALFDIGANVGLYSLYYVATQPGRCVAFEPSVFNLPLLARNVAMNDFQSRIYVVPLALSENGGFAEFNMSSTEEGAALSSFGVNYGSDGKQLSRVLSYTILGLSLDQLVDSGLLPERPRLVKIDVDGIEHLILRGATRTLSDPNCVSVLIEVSHRFHQQADAIRQILTECGFVFKEREGTGHRQLEVTENQIWVKSSLVG
jgi:FkbM family methyltransferase